MQNSDVNKSFATFMLHHHEGVEHGAVQVASVTARCRHCLVDQLGQPHLSDGLVYDHQIGTGGQSVVAVCNVIR